MDTILKLSAIAVFPVVVCCLIYQVERKGLLFQKNSWKKQLVIGVIFGILAILGTECGVDISGGKANTRDASVLIAGLVFGAPAGIIAGLIGGIERWFATLWGGGEYTRVACTISTILAGFISAGMRKLIFDDKKPSILHALAIGLVVEVFHMLMVLLTNLSDVSQGFYFIKKCAAPMITVNGVTVMVAVFLVTLIGKEGFMKKQTSRQISTVFQRWLLLCVFVSFSITVLITASLQQKLSEKNTDSLLLLNIRDVVDDVSDASDENLLNLAYKVREELKTNTNLNEIAQKYSDAEIDIVSKDGIITDTTYPYFLGYDMASGEQSAEFMCLLQGEEAYVQEYQPTASDRSISRKYAGVALEQGGFLQVGYDPEQFQKDIAHLVVGVTKNRHVGQNGGIIIADENDSIVSAPKGNEGRDLSVSGIRIDKESMLPETRYRAVIFGEDCYYMYSESEGYNIISIYPVSEATEARELANYITIFIEIIIFVSLFLIVYYLIKVLIVDNIRSINHSLSEISGGNLNVVVEVRGNEEFASLSDDINSTVMTLKRYIAEASARIDKELEMAKVIQTSTLPNRFPAYPDRKDFDIFASMNPAKEVGGDFYDFYLLDEKHLAFLIADVSGKGITAAMFMMKAKTLLKNLAEKGKSVAEILQGANEALCEGNDAEMFVTCFMGILDFEKNVIEYTNAGHNPPLLRRKGGEFEYFKGKRSLVLGAMSGIPYKSGEIEFKPGDQFFLYTDGVTEAENVTQDLYGEERLLSVLNQHAEEDVTSICREVKADVEEYAGSAPQFDDITMLCLKYQEITD